MGSNPHTTTLQKSLARMEPDLVQDFEDSAILDLKAEWAAMREELEARMREVEAAVMKNESRQENKHVQEQLERINRCHELIGSVAGQIDTLQRG